MPVEQECKVACLYIHKVRQIRQTVQNMSRYDSLRANWASTAVHANESFEPRSPEPRVRSIDDEYTHGGGWLVG